MKRYKLIGFLNLFNVVPDFVYPVFEYNDSFYFQDECNGKIIDFVLVKSSVYSMITKINEYKRVLGTKKAVLEIGSKSVYAFQIERGKIVCGEAMLMLNFFTTYTTNSEFLKREIATFKRELINSESVEEYKRKQKLGNKIRKFFGTGRVKNSIARVYLTPGTGKIIINKKDIDDYFDLETLKIIVRQPLETTNTTDKYDAKIIVRGGGFIGQAGAIGHGIASALLAADADCRPKLKKAGYLMRDSRMKERKTYGFKATRQKHRFGRNA